MSRYSLPRYSQAYTCDSEWVAWLAERLHNQVLGQALRPASTNSGFYADIRPTPDGRGPRRPANPNNYFDLWRL